MATTVAPPPSPPPGCGNIDPDYYFLCDTCEAWGIGLTTVAAAGILTSLILLLLFTMLACIVEDKNKKSMVPIQFFFIMGTLGIFSLTFAFIVRLNKKTGPARFLLHGVLFALCFSCLLTHAFNLIRLVRGKVPYSQRSLLFCVLGFTLVQIIIAVKYIVITVERDSIDLARMGRQQRNKDFVMLAIYVVVLMVLAFVTSMFTFCGAYKGWKKHGTHIFVTLLFSMVIWITWIFVFLRSSMSYESTQSKWDDPVISVTLVVNGLVFLVLYIVPEICFLASPCKPEDYPPKKSTVTQLSIEAGSTQAPDKEGTEEDVLLSANENCLQPKILKSKPRISIPRATLLPVYKQDIVVCSESKTGPTRETLKQYF
uniref:G-protein coupled receptors family 3 profile domain-containing protein n=1 Tax=Anolis carolinensis TaxID=28377 RepID=G1KXR0_ANOCA|nr:PREDICTED: retinoic acid-induced protein 3 [Anolis carolinensis]|eukprot:XP_003221096.2 PREDICTED: retinoic acid-induced protein 3 [Anolis carolinensis]